MPCTEKLLLLPQIRQFAPSHLQFGSRVTLRFGTSEVPKTHRYIQPLKLVSEAG
jgi:hypothetical protein